MKILLGILAIGATNVIPSTVLLLLLPDKILGKLRLLVIRLTKINMNIKTIVYLLTLPFVTYLIYLKPLHPLLILLIFIVALCIIYFLNKLEKILQ